VVGPPDRTLDEVPVVFVNTATDDPAVVDRIEAAAVFLRRRRLRVCRVRR
jgi:hypothetical protein